MLRRLLISYLVVPLVPPLVMIAWGGGWRMPFGDWFGIVLLYEVIGVLAMTVLATPLYFIYRRFGWTGWVAFMLGGGICAFLTSGILLITTRNLSQVPFFAALGMLAGLLFRFLLYGVNRTPSQDESTTTILKPHG